MINHSYAISLSALCFLSLAVSCQDEELGYTADQIAYRTNFEKAFGKISDVPTWDFSSYNLARLGLQGGPGASGSATRSAATHNWNDDAPCHGAIEGATAGNDILKTISGDAYYEVQQSTLNWLNTNLTEGAYNRDKGTSFKLVKPENNKDFLIIPIYQGHSGMSWDLHLVAENTSNQLKDYKIWSHSEGMMVTNNFNNGVEFYYNTADGDIDDVHSWEDGGFVKELLLKRAFPNLENISITDLQIGFEVPSGGKFEAFLTEKGYDGTLDSENRWGVSVDNTDGSKSGIRWFDIKEVLNQSWFPKDDGNITEGSMWNFVLRNKSYSGCKFDTFDEKRVRIFTKYNYSQELVLNDGTNSPCGSSTQNYAYRHTINRAKVESKPLRIDCSKIKDDFYFYLDVVKGDDYVLGDADQAVTGARQRSDEGMMLALIEHGNVGNLFESTYNLGSAISPFVTDLGSISSCEYFVVGCEDANLANSDWDINDVVFLIVGLDKAPKIKELVKKRYMIEDLGSTFDFDFNDIVVDVTQEKLKNVSTGEYSSSFNNNKGSRQIASIKHLCGTIPFKIKIGNSTLGGNDKVFQGCNEGAGEGDNGCDPLTHSPSNAYSDGINYEIEGWIPNDNNIIVTTYPNNAGWTDQGQTGFLGEHPQAEGHTFTFPETGKYPYIIACDQTVDWMPELITIPSSWFVTNPVYHGGGSNGNGGNNDGGNDNGDSGNDEPTTINDYTLGTPISVTYQSDNTGWNNYVKIESNLSGVQAGDKIIATISNVQSGAKLLFKKTPSSGWGDISSVDPLATTATEVILEVTAENIDDIKSGVAVQGLGFTLTEIQLVRELSLGDNGVLGGYGDGANKPQIEAALNKGDKIKIEYTLTGATGAIQVFERTGSEWGWTEKKEYYNITTSGSITCTMASNDVIHGIAIQGENITITKVSKIN